jgi:hypothetical protein
MTEEITIKEPSRVMKAFILVGCMVLGCTVGVAMACAVGYMMSP